MTKRVAPMVEDGSEDEEEAELEEEREDRELREDMMTVDAEYDF